MNLINQAVCSFTGLVDKHDFFEHAKIRSPLCRSLSVLSSQGG